MSPPHHAREFQSSSGFPLGPPLLEAVSRRFDCGRYKVLASLSGGFIISGAGMGGNYDLAWGGPQHTLVMRGASPAKRPSRASLEAHHSQARRSLRVAHVHPLRLRIFFLSAAAPDTPLSTGRPVRRRRDGDHRQVRGSRLAPAVAAVENTNKVDQQIPSAPSIGLGSPTGSSSST